LKWDTLIRNQNDYLLIQILETPALATKGPKQSSKTFKFSEIMLTFQFVKFF